MAKLPGLYERGGVFQLRVVVPLDLRAYFGGRSKLVETLGTSDRVEANRVGTARRALRLAEFDEKRRQASPQRLEAVSAELSKVLAQRVSAVILGSDETLRGSASAARLLMAALCLPGRRPYESANPRHRCTSRTCLGTTTRFLG